MKKIFILTGEPSGDKLASTVISKLIQKNSDIEYSCVGGAHLNSLGIKSIYDLKEITYIGFTNVLLNIFKIKKKINETEDKIIDFNPDILIKPKIICKTKSDLNIEPNKEWGKIKNVISISSVNGDGIDTLIKEITKLL